MNQPKEKESMSSINSKVANIEHYLIAVERDMNALAEEQEVTGEECSRGENSAGDGRKME
jgi:hypothetical protein